MEALDLKRKDLQNISASFKTSDQSYILLSHLNAKFLMKSLKKSLFYLFLFLKF